MKKIVAFGIAVLVLCFVFYPVIHRGKIAMTIRNDAAFPLTVLRVNKQEVKEIVQPGKSLKIHYRILHTGGIEVFLRNEASGEMLSKEVADYVQPPYYGRAHLVIKTNEHNQLSFKVKKSISY